MIELPKNANGKVDRVALKKGVEGVKEIMLLQLINMRKIVYISS